MAREALRFVEELGKLKGSYVKIGQMLAIFGEHLLPVELTDALNHLECQSIPLEWPAIEPTLTEQLATKMGELDIDTDAMAAASLGQVHMATIRKTGERICLKIQYPGIRGTIESDFRHFIRILKLAQWTGSSDELDDLLQEIRQPSRATMATAHHLNQPAVIEGLRKLRLIHDDQPETIHTLIAQFCLNLLELLRASFAGVPVMRLTVKAPTGGSSHGLSIEPANTQSNQPSLYTSDCPPGIYPGKPQIGRRFQFHRNHRYRVQWV